MSSKDYLKSWNDETVLEFFASNRRRIEDVYPSEKFFLDKYLKPDMTVLDYGCAAGGFSNILHTAYHVLPGNFWGVDQSSQMIRIAKDLYPDSHFDTNLSLIREKKLKFDMVFSFGVLHMTYDWESILQDLYDLSAKYLLFDLRIIDDGPSIEDIVRSFQVLAGDKDENRAIVPYIILNRFDLASRLKKIFGDTRNIVHHAYVHSVSETVTSVYEKVEMAAFCVTKDLV